MNDSNFPPILEDAESGLDINDNEQSPVVLFTSVYSKSSLPKGSVTFQQVIEEIQKEKEAEKALIEKTLNAFATAKKKTEENVIDKNAKNYRWKMASVKMLSRSKSQRDSISK